MAFVNGDRIELKTFLGTLERRTKVYTENNFWRLIGEKGAVIEDVTRNERALVMFEKNLDELEVANHNPIPNSLWIKPSDLRLDI
jgi:hypothetical protein